MKKYLVIVGGRYGGHYATYEDAIAFAELIASAENASYTIYPVEKKIFTPRSLPGTWRTAKAVYADRIYSACCDYIHGLLANDDFIMGYHGKSKLESTMCEYGKLKKWDCNIERIVNIVLMTICRPTMQSDGISGEVAPVSDIIRMLDIFDMN